MGDLPIALDLLNASLREGAISVQELIEKVKASPTTGMTAELSRLSDAFQGQVPEDALRGVAEAFGLSFIKLTTQAKTVARVLAQLGPEPIPMEFLKGLPQELNVTASRLALRARHFVTVSERHEGFASASEAVAGPPEMFGVMHRLMADYLRGLEDGAEVDPFLTACGILDGLMTFDRCKDPKIWPLLAALQPHAVAIFERNMKADGARAVRASDLVNMVGIFADSHGDYSTAQQLHASNLDLRRRVLGGDDERTLASSANLAIALRHLDHLTEARALQEETLSICRRVFGEQHVKTVNAIGSLASTLRNQGHFAEARHL